METFYFWNYYTISHNEKYIFIQLLYFPHV